MNKESVVTAQTCLRDFIYLDVALVGSYLEQLIGGVPNAVRVSHESEMGGNAGVNLSLLHVDFQKGGTRSYAENQTVYWARYARLEEELRKRDKVLELDARKSMGKKIAPHVLFLFTGSASFQPDWSNWNSGISLARIILGKLHQLNALEAAMQTPPDGNGMVPVLVGPTGGSIMALQKDLLSELLPKDLPEEPPENIRRLFKPQGVKIVLQVKQGRRLFSLEGIAAAQHFTPHRVDRYVLEPGKEDVDVLGLVTEQVEKSARFIPLAIFVRV